MRTKGKNEILNELNNIKFDPVNIPSDEEIIKLAERVHKEIDEIRERKNRPIPWDVWNQPMSF